MWEDLEDDFFNKLMEEENNDEDFPEENMDTRWGHEVSVKHTPAEDVTSQHWVRSINNLWAIFLHHLQVSKYPEGEWQAN